MLAGVSVDYYTKMERGNLRGVSESVLEALARGLQLRRRRARAPVRPRARRRADAAPAQPPGQAARPGQRAAHPRRDRRGGAAASTVDPRRRSRHAFEQTASRRRKVRGSRLVRPAPTQWWARLLATTERGF